MKAYCAVNHNLDDKKKGTELGYIKNWLLAYCMGRFLF